MDPEIEDIVHEVLRALCPRLQKNTNLSRLGVEKLERILRTFGRGKVFLIKSRRKLNGPLGVQLKGCRPLGWA
jgi:ArsR family metal-binding transcriptional regulator